MEYKYLRIGKNIFVCFFFFLIAFQFVEAKENVDTPPIEKAKSIKKEREIRKQKRFLKKAYKNMLMHSKEKNKKTLSLGTIIFFLLISLILFAIVGGLILGISMGTYFLWIIGVILLGISNLIGLILFLVYFLAKDKGYKEGKPRGWFEKNNHSLIFAFLALVIVYFAVGSIFFIWGLIISFSLFWIIGLIQLGIFLLIMLLFFIFMYTTNS